ncbi:hypothetical protein KBY97_12260 [Synechococcus sp. ATX 2A4]|uniref:hypothetical protein n=1 Tax=Synechococcus sp. ATX 2A4 TaxID=2823727 RepID=UPI0020CDDA07|nr:hypothetical protein [Synechococcus sp. ATX 2A4]MCP9885887.1 hypothetical protein [Synechococcus sp. ATX 2A4]
MADAPYLICLALLEQDAQRAMPLNGLSLKQAIAPGSDPGEAGKTLALELLIRLWQRSDAQPVSRCAGEASLLLLQLPLPVMQEQLPALKARWIRDGDSEGFLDQLRRQGEGLWRLSLARYEPLTFTAM